MWIKYLLDNLRPLHEKQDALRLCRQKDYAIMKYVASEFGWRGGRRMCQEKYLALETQDDLIIA